MAFKVADDYVDVAARIAEFRAKYPQGTLQPADLERPYTVQVIDGKTFIVVVAAAYRDADDERPGVGMAYEQFPGATPYTKNSELQNAETSAWGRAIVAVGAADTKKGIASSEEVRNRQGEQSAPAPPIVAPSPADQARGVLREWCAANKVSVRLVDEDHRKQHKCGIAEETIVSRILAHTKPDAE